MSSQRVLELHTTGIGIPTAATPTIEDHTQTLHNATIADTLKLPCKQKLKKNLLCST